MKAFLLYKNHDFDLQMQLPVNEKALIQDLELNMLFNNMALGDEFLIEVAKRAVLCSLNDVDTILYRQNILKDCLKNPSIVNNIYNIALEAIKCEEDNYLGVLRQYPEPRLRRSVEVLEVFINILKKLRNIGDENSDKFESEGFSTFFIMIIKELSDEYFAIVKEHLEELKFSKGVLISAELGKGNKGNNYMIRKSKEKHKGVIKQFFATKPPSYSIYLDERDDSGIRALSELKDRGINIVANALAQSTDHIFSFFNMLKTELSFYIGCMNLHRQLIKNGEPISFPIPISENECRHSFEGLYDACLSLRINQRIVGSDVNANNKNFIIISGANQGGKSTFLRSIGLSQLMMQCGMFVPAISLSASICNKLFTHYQRKDDSTMNSGKLDEELSRMSNIVDLITPNSMMLFNESFAAINEREGSEIARQIVCALLEKHIKIFFVTHLYEFAHGFYNKKMENALFLRAERKPDGDRTFKLIQGEPLQTSFGEDLYYKMFKTNN